MEFTNESHCHSLVSRPKEGLPLEICNINGQTAQYFFFSPNNLLDHRLWTWSSKGCGNAWFMFVNTIRFLYMFSTFSTAIPPTITRSEFNIRIWVNTICRIWIGWQLYTITPYPLHWTIAVASEIVYYHIIGCKMIFNHPFPTLWAIALYPMTHILRESEATITRCIWSHIPLLW